MNIFLILILCIEAVLLFLLEKKMWRTGYTPLNFLMLPYVFVLGFTLLVAGRWGIVDFYYPSLIPWIIGLPLFAIPGWLFFLAERRFPSLRAADNKTQKQGYNILQNRGVYFDQNPKYYRFQIGLSAAVVIMLSVRLIVFLAQGRGMIGSEYFGHLFAGKGWAGHLLLIGVALLILLLFDNRRWRTCLVSAFIIFFLFVYQVKSWIILPLLTVFFALLMAGRIKFNFRRVLYVGVGFTLVFFTSYLLIYVSGNKLFPEATNIGDQLKAIAGLFVHYLTSGTLGLSADMQQGILEEPNLQYIFTPLYNLWHALTGQPIVSGMNHEFLYTGINATNVRGFFGTLFIFTRPVGFAVCCLLFGTGCQFVFWLFRRYKNTCIFLLYAWICTVLFMGWFDFFPYLSNVFEIPFWIVAITLLQQLFFKSDKKKRCKFNLQPYKRLARNILVLLQTIAIALLVAFFWTPWRLPSYFLGVSVGIAFVFMPLVPRRSINFCFLRPYAAFLLLYLLYWVSVLYSSCPEKAIQYGLHQISILLVPFVFWGMTPRFFSPRRLEFFATCFVLGSVALLIAKIFQLGYCFHILWPFFKVWYIETGGGLLYTLNEFLSYQNVYLSWTFLSPIMHTTIEALIFILAWAFIFIARVKQHPMLDSRFKKCVADFILLLFASMLIVSNSKTGQFMFGISLILLLAFAFRQKRWKIAYGLSASLFLLSIVEFHYFGMSILSHFEKSIHVVEDIKSNEQETTNDGSLLPRLYSWETAVELVKEKPLLGFGYDAHPEFYHRFITNYPDYPKPTVHPHNQFLYVLIINGAVGLVVFLLFWAQVVHLVWKNRRLWGWIWLLSLFAFCCIEAFIKNVSLLYACMPYCFLMAEYYNQQAGISVNSQRIPTLFLNLKHGPCKMGLCRGVRKTG